MKNLRVMLAATLALAGADALRAQTPPPMGTTPSDPAAIVLGAPPLIDNGAVVPRVAIGDNASPNVPKVWYDLHWMFAWTSPSRHPAPYLTTSDPFDAGILGAPTTTTLSGGVNRYYGTYSGVAFSSGSWWDSERTIGMEGSSLWSETRVLREFFASDPDGFPPMYRPIYDPAVLAESSTIVAQPFEATGTFMNESKMRFTTGDTNLMFNIARNDVRSWTALLGYRFTYFEESTILTQETTYLVDGIGFFQGAPLLAGEAVRITDRVSTINRGLTGQVGLRYERNAGRFSLALTTKIGFGWSQQRIFGDGRSELIGGAGAVPGGLLIQQSFPYRNQLEEFLVNPEADIRVGIRVWRRFSVSFSYNILYFSTMSRPGSYFDRTVELTQVPTSASYTGVTGTRPRFFESDTDMFLHAATIGLSWRY